jgi:hypothetical protein
MKFKQYMQKKDSAKPLNESKAYNAINEAKDGGLFDFFKSIKAFAVLSTQWPKLYQEKKDAELEKANGKAKMDAKIAERMIEVEEKIDAQIKQQLENMPREKRAAAREKMEERAKLQKSKASEQFAAKKSNYEKQMDAKISDINTDLAELEKDNEISSDLLSKKFQKIKNQAILDIDSKFEEDKIEAIFKAKEDLLSDEKIEAMRAKAKKAISDIKSEQEEKIARLEKEAADKEKEMDEKIAAKEGEAKETLANMKEAQAGIQKYLAKGKKVAAMMGESQSATKYISQIAEYNVELDEAEDGGEEELKKEKQELTDIRKDVQAKIDKLSISKIKKALDVEEGDATEILNTLEDQWEDVKRQYSKIRDEVKTDLDTDDDETTTKNSGEDEDDKTTTKNSGEDENEDGEDLTDKQKERMQKAKDGLANAEKDGDTKKAERYKALISKIGKKLGEDEDFDKFLESIDEELSFLAEDSAPASLTRKIVSFSDYMSRKSN